MPMGSVFSVLDPAIKPRLYRRLFGFEEFHTHIRWKAIRRYIDFAAGRTLEVGADMGFMAFEIAQRNPTGAVVASELNPDAVQMARVVAERAHLSNVTILEEDLLHLAHGEAYDQVLVVDVFEHIQDDIEAMRQVHTVVKPGGRLVVSVPAPSFNDHFGWDFAERIGHVRPGYTIEEMTAALDKAGFDVTDWHYYTGPVAAKLCERYYKNPLPRRLSYALMPLALAVALPFEKPSRTRGASLALVAVAR
jgi:SAM-dependent methyltransferase